MRTRARARQSPPLWRPARYERELVVGVIRGVAAQVVVDAAGAQDSGPVTPSSSARSRREHAHPAACGGRRCGCRRVMASYSAQALTRSSRMRAASPCPPSPRGCRGGFRRWCACCSGSARRSRPRRDRGCSSRSRKQCRKGRAAPQRAAEVEGERAEPEQVRGDALKLGEDACASSARAGGPRSSRSSRRPC